MRDSWTQQEELPEKELKAGFDGKSVTRKGWQECGMDFWDLQVN